MAPREVTRERPKPGNRSAAAASSVIGFLRALICAEVERRFLRSWPHLDHVRATSESAWVTTTTKRLATRLKHGESV
jgi:hypothetical protein